MVIGNLFVNCFLKQVSGFLFLCGSLQLTIGLEEVSFSLPTPFHPIVPPAKDMTIETTVP